MCLAMHSRNGDTRFGRVIREIGGEDSEEG
jgi:hypothetical protein